MNKKKISDLEGLVDLDSLMVEQEDIHQDESGETVPEESCPGHIPSPDTKQEISSIWEQFCLNINDEKFWKRQEKQKICMVDNDIAETISECDFSSMSRNAVINAILRTFILACKSELSAKRKQRVTLLDK